MLPKIFKPKYEYDLIRLGKDNDGGYLVEKESIFKSKSKKGLNFIFPEIFPSEKVFLKLACLIIISLSFELKIEVILFLPFLINIFPSIGFFSF